LKQRVNDLGPSSFADIGDAFDDGGHDRSSVYGLVAGGRW
jgi:hypothetical protein